MIILTVLLAIQNPSIDMAGYLAVAKEAAQYRESHRVSEEEFVSMSGEPDTIILDARSTEKFEELHIRGAINLSFPDIAIESLKHTIPSRNTRILIYCNNNFINAERAFPSKIARASLNLSTFIALYSYGYRNVYELAPLIDIKNTKLAFDAATPIPPRP
ncbi:MAG TPA: rhodanese-like domain-containing protein [Thermoanaerobaculia bacterium]|nr:rhodanese-like domain-containing protein [Thermoanaerobaculia bacterium]